MVIARGETLSVVGESAAARASQRSRSWVCSTPARRDQRQITFRTDGGERNLLHDLEHYVTLEEQDGRIMEVSKDEAGWGKQVERIMAEVRGRKLAMIFQNPKSALNPFVTVGHQITEAIRLHTPT